MKRYITQRRQADGTAAPPRENTRQEPRHYTYTFGPEVLDRRNQSATKKQQRNKDYADELFRVTY